MTIQYSDDLLPDGEISLPQQLFENPEGIPDSIVVQHWSLGTVDAAIDSGLAEWSGEDPASRLLVPTPEFLQK